MKNQALTITLAVLLALSLAAVGVLFVTGSGAGSTVVVADPAAVVAGDIPTTDQAAASTDDEVALAVEIVEVDQNDEPATDEEPAGEDAPPVDEPTDDEPAAPGDDEPADDEPAAPGDDDPADDEPAAPGDDEPGDETPAAPGDDEPTDDEPAVPGDDDPADDEPTDDEPAAPGDDEPADDEPGDDTPPCPGPVTDGVCTPAICFAGYAWSHDAQTCVFVGCPDHLVLVDGWCEPPVVGPAPCDIGFYRNDDGDCVPFVFIDPGTIIPDFCGDGLMWLNGECVSVCPEGHTWIGGFCLEIDIPDFEINPDLLPDFDEELLSPDFEFDPALFLELDLSALGL